MSESFRENVDSTEKLISEEEAIAKVMDLIKIESEYDKPDENTKYSLEKAGNRWLSWMSVNQKKRYKFILDKNGEIVDFYVGDPKESSVPWIKDNDTQEYKPVLTWINHDELNHGDPDGWNPEELTEEELIDLMKESN